MYATLGAIVEYVATARRFSRLPSTTEGTYYPLICELINAVLKENRLPFEARAGTAQKRRGSGTARGGVDRPDFVLGDDALFVGVFGEVKPPDVTLDEMAQSTDRNDQIGRYLAQTGAVLISNARSFGLLICAAGYERAPGIPVPPNCRELIAIVDLWGAVQGSGLNATVDAQARAAFVEMKGKLEVVTVGDHTFGRGTFEPGWRWSEHVKPIAGTPSCQAAHTGYVLEGRMVVKMNDGAQVEYGPGDAFYMPPGHDAWIVGDEVCHREAFLMPAPCVVTLDFAGGSGHRWTVGHFVTSDASLPARHNSEEHRTSFISPSAGQRRERHDRALGTTEEADDKSVEADLHGEPGRSARFL